MFANCLTLIDSLPFFAECKRESYDLLGAAPGCRILEVGCGLGDDAAALAGRVAPGGSVLAIDGSQVMVDAARRRHGAVAGLAFEVADATQLPYQDASFDGCRIDRVLQHIGDPSAAIGEMARVLRPGGVLVAFDSDWETLTIDSPDRAFTRAVLNAWCDRFPSGWIGRRMRALFLDAGLSGCRNASEDTRLQRPRDRRSGFQLLRNSRWTRQRQAPSARMTPTAGNGRLRDSDAAGRFFTSYTGFLVSGTRPVYDD